MKRPDAYTGTAGNFKSGNPRLAATPAAQRSAGRQRAVLIAGAAVVVAAWLFGSLLRAWLLERATLANPAPPSQLVEDFIEQSKDPVAAILAAWETGHIVHRDVAIRHIPRTIPITARLPDRLEELVLAGALDADESVRRTAMGVLRDRRHPATAALAAAQFEDPDPELRLLGLEALRSVDARSGVPLVVPLLEETDPRVVTTFAPSTAGRCDSPTFAARWGC